MYRIYYYDYETGDVTFCRVVEPGNARDAMRDEVEGYAQEVGADIQENWYGAFHVLYGERQGRFYFMVQTPHHIPLSKGWECVEQEDGGIRFTCQSNGYRVTMEWKDGIDDWDENLGGWGHPSLMSSIPLSTTDAIRLLMMDVNRVSEEFVPPVGGNG